MNIPTDATTRRLTGQQEAQGSSAIVRRYAEADPHPTLPAA
ncbi:hypothetical protein [Hymenobacter jejuensis]|nr:hypothetical protein [Hymenobacter jejuensis]